MLIAAARNMTTADTTYHPFPGNTSSSTIESTPSATAAAMKGAFTSGIIKSLNALIRPTLHFPKTVIVKMRLSYETFVMCKSEVLSLQESRCAGIC